MVKASLRDIINVVKKINFIPTQISYFCHDLKILEKYIEYCKEPNPNIEEFLIKHEKYINKDEFLLLIIALLQTDINDIRSEMMNNASLNYSEVENKRLNIIIKDQILQELLKMATNLRGCVSEYDYDQRLNRYFIRVINSSEVIDGRREDNSGAIQKFDRIDFKFQSNIGEYGGIEHALQVLVLTDLYEVFNNPKIGIDTRTMIIQNQILRKKIKTFEELEDLKESDLSGYNELEMNFVTDNETLDELKRTLRMYAQYLNFDKLLLIIAYRVNDALENDRVEIINFDFCKILLETIDECIENKNIRLTNSLQEITNVYTNENPKLIQLNYSLVDLKRCIEKFTNSGYITDKHCEEIQEKIANGEMNLDEIESDVIDVIFSRKKLEEYSMISEENFLYVAIKNNWDTKKIVDRIKQLRKCSTETLIQLRNAEKIEIYDLKELYLEGIISIEIFQKINEECNVEELVNSYELIDYYIYSNQKDINEEEKRREKLDKYLELYKFLLSDKSEIDKKEISERLTTEILEKLDDKEEIELVKLCYIKGLIFLETIAEWYGINTIEQFYQEEIINIDCIIELGKKGKIPIEFIISKMKSIIEDINVDYDIKIRYLKTGLLDESYISDLYRRNIIFEKDFIELGRIGIISSTTIDKVIKSKKLEDAEDGSAIRITGIDRLTKISTNIYGNGTNNARRKVKQEIIDPIKREEYIRMLNAYRAITDLDEDSAFYHYEFYVIPEESGEIGLDSIVIAERYYEDKDTEERFATNNATYFFKYKDLMVLSRFPKSEMTKERKGVVFTSKHTMATEQRVGSWASSVVYNIIKTRLSSSLDEYSKKNKRLIVIQGLEQMYSREELIEIFNMGISIDQGEFNCYIEEPEGRTSKKPGEAR